MALDRVRYVGQALALILADTPERARDAAELIAVDYEPLPAVVAMMAAIAPDAPQLWREAPVNVAFTWEAGDRAATEAAFAAHRVVEAEIVNSRIMMAALETRGRSSNSMPQRSATRSTPPRKCCTPPTCHSGK
jgi:carbon-monoxide dehydrogenase large subunit